MLQARLFLSQHLSVLYPGFENWFSAKVENSSTAIVLGSLKEGHLVGIAIGKMGDDPKLRCVRVHDDFQGAGLGLRLVDKMIDYLECEKPHCTVAEEMMHDYSRAFVKRYGFALSDVTKGEYRKHKLEYHWN